MLSFENNAQQRSYEKYFLPSVKIKDCNVMIDRRNLFDQTFKNNEPKYDGIWKFANGQGDDYAASRLPDYSYFKTNYETIAVDLGKQKSLKLIQKRYNNIILFEI